MQPAPGGGGARSSRRASRELDTPPDRPVVASRRASQGSHQAEGGHGQAEKGNDAMAVAAEIATGGGDGEGEVATRPARNRRTSSVDLKAKRPTRRRRASRESIHDLLQGDATFDLPEMRRKRQALREDPMVAEALNEWWIVTDSDGNGEIDRDEYMELGKALYRVMIADGNEAAAAKSAANDWEEDSKGREVMDSEMFKSAIFELADLWTKTLDPSEYVAFLKQLLVKMKAAGLGGDLLLGVQLHKGVNRSRRGSKESIPTITSEPNRSRRGSKESIPPIKSEPIASTTANQSAVIESSEEHSGAFSGANISEMKKQVVAEAPAPPASSPEASSAAAPSSSTETTASDLLASMSAPKTPSTPSAVDVPTTPVPTVAGPSSAPKQTSVVPDTETVPKGPASAPSAASTSPAAESAAVASATPAAQGGERPCWLPEPTAAPHPGTPQPGASEAPSVAGDNIDTGAIRPRAANVDGGDGGKPLPLPVPPTQQPQRVVKNGRRASKDGAASDLLFQEAASALAAAAAPADEAPRPLPAVGEDAKKTPASARNARRSRELSFELAGAGSSASARSRSTRTSAEGDDSGDTPPPKGSAGTVRSRRASREITYFPPSAPGFLPASVGGKASDTAFVSNLNHAGGGENGEGANVRALGMAAFDGADLPMEPTMQPKKNELAEKALTKGGPRRVPRRSRDLEEDLDLFQAPPPIAPRG